MPETTVLAAAPFPLTLRNFVPTGLVAELERRYQARVHFVSPYPQPEFTDTTGASYPNLPVTAGAGAGGVPTVAGTISSYQRTASRR